MSVRNILDGTIKVGGDGSGTSKRELFVEELSADRCYFTNIERCGIIKTTNLIADGSIDMQVGINEPKPLAYITKGDKITVEADNLIAGSNLTVGGSEVLKMTKSSGSRVIVGTLASSGNQMTFSATGSSRILDITSEMHAVGIIATMKECVTMKSLTFNTGLKLEGRQTRVIGNTVCQIGEAYLDAYVDLYMENDYLMAKLTFKDTPEYTSMSIKINMIFY